MTKIKRMNHTFKYVLRSLYNYTNWDTTTWTRTVTTNHYPYPWYNRKFLGDLGRQTRVRRDFQRLSPEPLAYIFICMNEGYGPFCTYKIPRIGLSRKWILYDLLANDNFDKRLLWQRLGILQVLTSCTPSLHFFFFTVITPDTVVLVSSVSRTMSIEWSPEISSTSLLYEP